MLYIKCYPLDMLYVRQVRCSDKLNNFAVLNNKTE